MFTVEPAAPALGAGRAFRSAMPWGVRIEVGTALAAYEVFTDKCLARGGEFRRCLAEKLLTYALGRGLEYYDKCTVDTIVRNVAANHDKFSGLVLEIVGSDAFQKRRGKRGDEP